MEENFEGEALTQLAVMACMESLRFERDERAPPDNHRRGQFAAGWDDATVRRLQYKDDTLTRLTWHNLGYRFGERFGLRSREEVERTFEYVADLYHLVRADGLAALPGELPITETLTEGRRCQVIVESVERNRTAVARCKQIHGTSCIICDFDFAKVYGEEFAGFIHAHHLRPISANASEYVIDPGADLVPVCPNCHAVIHYRGRLRTTEEVRACLVRNRDQ